MRVTVLGWHDVIKRKKRTIKDLLVMERPKQKDGVKLRIAIAVNDKVIRPKTLPKTVNPFQLNAVVYVSDGF
jgi:hypothetical protein